MPPRAPGRGFVIFGGGNHRAVVAFLREIRRLGADYYIVARTDSDPILRTAYRGNVVFTRATHALDLKSMEESIEKVRAVAGARELVVCPSSEFLNVFLLANRAFFAERGFIIPLVGKDIYELVSNKYSFTGLCKNNGFRVPDELDAAASGSFPFVARPRTNVNAENKSLYPYIISDEADLGAFRAQEKESDFFFQRYVPGESYYLLYYLSQRGTVFLDSQKNLLQQADGKSIVMACSADIHRSPLAGRFADMLRDTGFHGLAMVELRLHDGEFYPIELNPRLWGPSQLTVDSGSGILRAFIMENLSGSLPEAPGPERLRQSRYLWLGGIAQDISGGKKSKWHVDSHGPIAVEVLRNILHDVYLKPDAWLLFARELYETIKNRKKRSSG